MSVREMADIEAVLLGARLAYVNSQATFHERLISAYLLLRGNGKRHLSSGRALEEI